MWQAIQRRFLHSQASRAGGKAVAFTTAVGAIYYMMRGLTMTANADSNIDDKSRSFAPLSSGSHANQDTNKKPNLIILGSGWSAVSMMKELGDDYDITVVSPRNYFLFTPLLPGVTTGTNEERSIIEPIRKFTKKRARKGMAPIKFYEAKCIDIDPTNNTIECVDTSDIQGAVNRFTLPYDYLVIAIGAKNNTFGTPGVEKHANFLKSVEDAVKIRSHIIDAFETACLPGQPEEERKRLLRFLVVGGGPTGVEFAAELNDFIVEDVKNYYPQVMNDVSIVLVQSADHILNTFDQKINVENRFRRANIQVMTGCRVQELREKEVIVLDKRSNTVKQIPYGVCVWSTGIAPHELTKKLQSKIESQRHLKALVVDPTLKVVGTQNIYALGDSCVVQFPKLHHRLTELFKQTDKNGDGVLSEQEFEDMFTKLVEEYPQLQVYKRKVLKLFHENDVNKDGVLSLDEFEALLKQADSNLTTLPATAQVASQQGAYLADAFNRRAKGLPVKPFEYRHIASFAKVGSSDAVFEMGKVKAGGFSSYWMWMAVYLSKQFSLRNRFLVASDWIRTLIFGRDVSRF